MSLMTRTPCDDGVLRAGAPETPCNRDTGRWVLAATILGSSMAFIDGTVVNVALPALQASLGATAADAQWVVESYALLLAALLLVGGALGDRFGRRRIFGLGVVLFTVASMWCGLAPNVAQLIAARGAQGVGAALLVPGSLAIISASFDDEARGAAIGTWSGFTAITAALGPLLGGWLIEELSWRWVFFINLPIGLVVLAILFARVPESRDEASSGRLDVAGAVLATVGLGGATFALIEAGRLGWNHGAVLAAGAAGVAALIGFVLVERSVDAPMLPPELFRSRAFSGANLLTLLLYAALGGALFFLPFNLIQVQGYSATAAGAAFLPFIGLMFLLSRWSGGLVARVGPRLPLIVGPSIAAVGLALLARPGVGGSYWTTFFPPVLVLGFGMAIAVAPLTTVVMEAVPARRSGIASGVNNAVSRTASLLSVAAFGLVMSALFSRHLELRLAAIDAPPPVVEALRAQRDSWAAAEVPATADPAVAERAARAVDEAFVAGFRRIAWIASALALASAVVAAATIRGDAAAVRAPDTAEPGAAPIGAGD